MSRPYHRVIDEDTSYTCGSSAKSGISHSVRTRSSAAGRIPRTDCDPWAGPVITLLPHYQQLLGPATQARIVRLFLLYLLLLAAGSALLAFADDDHLRLFGMGLALPGGGFLAHSDICNATGIGHTSIALLAFGAFGVSMALWFGTGNILAPPLTWLATAIAGGAIGQGGVRPGAVALLFSGVGAALALLLLSMGCWFLAARRRRGLDNAYRAAQTEHTAAIFTAPAPRDQAEMTLDHLRRLRFALDRALQPLSQFNGFEHLDQFQTAAMRYQLNFLGYSVALTQARYTPAFSGHMHEAQIACSTSNASIGYGITGGWKTSGVTCARTPIQPRARTSCSPVSSRCGWCCSQPAPAAAIPARPADSRCAIPTAGTMRTTPLRSWRAWSANSICPTFT